MKPCEGTQCWLCEKQCLTISFLFSPADIPDVFIAGFDESGKIWYWYIRMVGHCSVCQRPTYEGWTDGELKLHLRHVKIIAMPDHFFATQEEAAIARKIECDKVVVAAESRL
jgi:hypothetical protein